MNRTIRWMILILCVGSLGGWLVAAQTNALKKWQKGKGWGWVWGKDDEVGALNEMTDASRLAALRLADRGRTFDLGVTYDRTS